MSKSTNPITYRYNVDGHTIEVTRRHIGTAYARNGNTGNPTEYFTWESSVDGVTAVTGRDARASAYEYARAKVLGYAYFDHANYPHRWRGVRSYVLVADEMKANYVGRR